MKQINDLIVLSVPKNSKNHRIDKSEMLNTVWYDNSNTEDLPNNPILPPGQYEIIGLYSEWTHEKECAISNAANVVSVPHLLMLHQLLPTDTTDLLFIHKLK